MDKIFIRQLQVPAIIGVLEEERLAKQTLLLDLELFTNTRLAATSDNVAQTINYATVRKAVLSWAAETEFQLIEALAHHLAQKLLDCFDIGSVKLTLSKQPFDITDALSVGITIQRQATTASLQTHE